MKSKTDNEKLRQVLEVLRHERLCLERRIKKLEFLTNKLSDLLIDVEY